MIRLRFRTFKDPKWLSTKIIKRVEWTILIIKMPFDLADSSRQCEIFFCKYILTLVSKKWMKFRRERSTVAKKIQCKGVHDEPKINKKISHCRVKQPYLNGVEEFHWGIFFYASTSSRSWTFGSPNSFKLSIYFL